MNVAACGECDREAVRHLRDGDIFCDLLAAPRIPEFDIRPLACPSAPIDNASGKLRTIEPDQHHLHSVQIDRSDAQVIAD
ncbi:hypothetical protein LGR44_17470 [Microvirga sp. SM9]|nr:hypothetical protein [Microvirga lenta]